MEKKCLFSFMFFICLLSQCGADLKGFRICFEETSNSLYQGISSTCSGYSDTNKGWSQPFRDDTGGKSRSHVYKWRIEAGDKILSNKEYRLCFNETEGTTQCWGWSSCTGWSGNPNWTASFWDLTDRRSGGCRYSWMIESKDNENLKEQLQVCRVCFKARWSTFGCKGKSQRTCSGWARASGKNPSWTLPYYDNTRGCIYQWYLDCTTKDKSFDCLKERPCGEK